MNIEKMTIDAITSIMNLEGTHHKLNRETLLSELFVDEIDIIEIAMYIEEDCRLDIMDEVMELPPEHVLKFTIGNLIDMIKEKANVHV